MTLWLRDLLDRFDLLSLRERVMIMGAAVLLTVMVWDGLLMEPQAKARKARLGQVEALRAEVAGLTQGIESMAAQGVVDPDRQAREAVAALRQEIAALDARMAGATSGLIAPREMAQVLEQLLDRTSKLTLHGLRTLPPEAVSAPARAGSAPTTQIYKHGVELELGGTYLETLEFLQALEALPWRFFWDRVEFTVQEHPQGRARLTLYTLGLQEGWIGV
jgi:MSHA biogenesis protein MshJ